MSGLLLDTNALLWVLTDHRELGDHTRTLVTTSRPVHFSAVSVLEVTIKLMLGRLELPAEVSAAAQHAGLTELPFRAAHASRLHDFPDLSRHDPFDRMLLAQALCDDLLLLTSGQHLLGLAMPWVLDARQ